MSRLVDRRLHRRARSARARRNSLLPLAPAPPRAPWWEDWAIGGIVVAAIANGLYLVFTS